MRHVAVSDIEERLRSAGDFLGRMILYEAEALEASKKAFMAGHRDFAEQTEAIRKVQREFEAFLALV